MKFPRTCPYLGKTQQVLSIRNTPVAFSTFTNLIPSLHIWLVPYFNPASIPSPPLTIDLIVHALFLSPFHSSIGVFTCLYLCLPSWNPISFWFWWCLNGPLSQAHLCVPQQLARWWATWNRVKAAGRGSNGCLTGTGTNLAIFSVRPGIWKMVPYYSGVKVP